MVATACPVVLVKPAQVGGQVGFRVIVVLIAVVPFGCDT
jgi:hypothetical protein